MYQLNFSIQPKLEYFKHCCSLPHNPFGVQRPIPSKRQLLKSGTLFFFSIAFRATSKSQSHYSTSQFAFDRKQRYPEGWCILLSRFSSCIFQVKEVIKEDLLYKHTCLFQLPTESSPKWGWGRRGQLTKTKRARGKTQEAAGVCMTETRGERRERCLNFVAGGGESWTLSPVRKAKGQTDSASEPCFGNQRSQVTLRRSVSFRCKLQESDWLA